MKNLPGNNGTNLDVSIVIPSYNRAWLLGRCLDHLASQDYPLRLFEVIVVDDGSNDETQQEVSSKNRGLILHYLRSSHRVGPAAARNQALEKVNGNVVLFLDSDVLAPPSLVRRHVRAHQTHPRIFLDGPVVEITSKKDVENPPFHSWRTKLLAFLDVAGAAFITANTSVTRQELARAGGFDEKFVWAWEDIELGHRLRQQGLRRMKDRGAYVLHCKTNRPSLSELAALKEQRGEFAGMFYRKHPTPSNGRSVRLRYLTCDRILRRIGLTDDRLQRSYSLLDESSPYHRVTKKLYLIRAHARGLSKGLNGGARHAMPEDECASS
jgi:glycosyltransferase involved in cell wall biosynthesis